MPPAGARPGAAAPARRAEPVRLNRSRSTPASATRLGGFFICRNQKLQKAPYVPELGNLGNRIKIYFCSVGWKGDFVKPWGICGESLGNRTRGLRFVPQPVPQQFPSISVFRLRNSLNDKPVFSGSPNSPVWRHRGLITRAPSRPSPFLRTVADERPVRLCARVIDAGMHRRRMGRLASVIRGGVDSGVCSCRKECQKWLS